MSDDSRIEKIAEQVNTIHVVLLGTNEQGGLLREVGEIRKDVSELKGFRARITGIAVGASALVSIAMAKLFGK